MRLRQIFLLTTALTGVALFAWACASSQPAQPPQVVKQPTPKPPPPPPPSQRAETRAIWVSDTSKLDWETATAKLQRAGFNTMYVNLASGGAAFYPSALVPNAGNMAASTIEDGIALAHRRGLKVYAKQIVMFMFKTSPIWQRTMVGSGRVMRGPEGQLIMQNDFAWLCPSQMANRSLLLKIVAEMLGRYPVDGVQFDYIRFNEQPSCYCAHCRKEFERFAGVKIQHWPEDAVRGEYATRFNEWRVQLITEWVRELSATARRTRPGLAVNAAVFSDLDRAREEKAQDWKTWLERGYVDQVSTMTYTADTELFEALVRKQIRWAPRREQIVVGIGSWKFQDMVKLWGHIGIVRRLGVPGFALFSYDDAATRKFLPNLTGTPGTAIQF